MLRFIKNVTVVCPTRSEPSRNVDVTIADGCIATVEPTLALATNRDSSAPTPEREPVGADQADVVDGTGLFLMPGIIDTHTHLTFRRTYGPLAAQLRTIPATVLAIRGARAGMHYLKQGITTTRDLGSMYEVTCELRDLIDLAFIPGPRVLAAGSPLSASGGHSISAVRHVDGPYDARKAGREWAAKYDLVKIFASYDPLPRSDGELARPELRLDEVRAIADEAHNVGKRVAAHSNGTQAIRICIEGGVDSIEHGIYLDEELAHAMVAAGSSLVPTLSGYVQNANPKFGRGAAWGDRLAAMIAAHHRSYSTAVQVGVHVSLGLDSLGDLDEELKLLQDLGELNEHELLTIATLNGAITLGLEDETGSIEPHKRADLLLVGSDPSRDLRAALQEIRLVVKAGQATEPDSIGLSLTEESHGFTSFSERWRVVR